MRIGALAAAFVLLCAWQGSAMAQTSQDERIRKLEQRIRYLENRVADQDKAIVNKDREAKEEQADKWFSKVEIGGAVELELSAGKDYDGKSSSGFDAGTVELGVAAQVHDWVSGEIVLAWNGDDEKVEVDTATVTVAQPDGMFSFIGGIQTVPFGTYETNLISDPLTLDIGEVGATAGQFVMEAGGINASAFVFKGGNNRGGHDRIANYGFALGYAYEGGFNLGLNASYINDIAEADGFELDGDALEAGRAIGGAHFSAMAGFGPVSVIAEYVTALKAFPGKELASRAAIGTDNVWGPNSNNENADDDVLTGAKPSAWSVEAALTFEVMKSEITAAASYQKTKQAFGLGLPESRYLVGVSVGIVEGVSVAGEVAFDKDYGEGVCIRAANDGGAYKESCGTGNNATTFTLLFAAEF